MATDLFGERIKEYEKQSQVSLFSNIPAICRLDGKNFSKFTKGLDRPYDSSLSTLMRMSALYLCKEFNAFWGYTQSDEITLILWLGDNQDNYFGGRIQKLSSIIASKLSVYFNRRLGYFIPKKAKEYPIFDARVFNVPSKEEALNTILWREIDCRKNSISMAAQNFYSHKQLHKKTSSDKLDMLGEVGIDWHTYPGFFKYGTHISKRKELKKFSNSELESLPKKHEARKNPNLEILRSVWYFEDKALNNFISFDERYNWMFESN